MSFARECPLEPVHPERVAGSDLRSCRQPLGKGTMSYSWSDGALAPGVLVILSAVLVKLNEAFALPALRAWSFVAR